MIAIASIVLKATALLAMAALIGIPFRRRGSAALRHLIWTSVLTALLVLPFAEVTLPHWTLPLPIAAGSNASRAASPIPYRPSAFASQSEREPAAIGARQVPSAGPEYAPASSALLVATVVVYAVGGLLLLVRLARESNTLRRLRRVSREIADPAWRHLLDESTALLRITRPVRLSQAQADIVPITFGTLVPVVVLPASADGWALDRRRAVLLHELAHIARRDCLAQLVGAVACAMYWPHPGVWFAARRLRLERELAADDRVLAAGAEPQTYAGHLLELARSLTPAPAPATALAMARVRDLEARLRAIVDGARNRSLLPRWGAVAAIASVVTIVLTIATLRARIVDAQGLQGVAQHQAAFSRAAQKMVAAIQGAEDPFGTWEVRLSDDGSSAQVTVRTAHGSHGETVPTARLEAIAGVRVAGVTGPVRFAIHRDQGTFVGDGTCRDGVCTGSAGFEPDPAFAAGLARRGIGAPAPSEAAQMAVHDVGFEFIDEIAKDGYAKPDIQTLIRAAQHGVGLDYVREMTSLGYKFGTLDGLVRLRDHGVDPVYVRDMAAHGMGQLSADDLVRARDHGVDPAYVHDMRAQGLDLPDLDAFIDARAHGVDPEFARGLASLGFGKLGLTDLMNARAHGIDPDYISSLASLGHKGLSLEALINLRSHGIDADYISGLAALGYKALSLDALINLRSHGVDPDYISGLAAFGYTGLPIDTLVRMRGHGVDPEYVRSLKEKGVTGLTPDQLIDRRSRGVDDPGRSSRELFEALRSYWRSLVGH